MFSLKNRVVVVSGASSGLGAQMVLAYADQGADLVITARRIEKLEILADAIRAKGVCCLPIKATGVALELNNSSIVPPRNSRSGGVKNARRLPEQCALAGAQIMVGSDSRIWYDVGDFECAVALLKDVRFPQRLVVNADLARFQKFMEQASECERATAVA